MQSRIFFLSFIIIGLVALNIGFTKTIDPFIYQSHEENQIMILDHGMHSLEKRLDLIQKAQKTIEIEYFIFTRHKSARLLTQALVKKAREGVKVKMLMDHFMIRKTLNTYLAHELRANGVEFKYYNTTPMVRFIEAQYRNHRKSLIIDGQEAIIGGRNVGDEYFDLSADYNFVDRDIWIKGPAVEKIRHTFRVIWNDKESKFKKRPRKPVYRNFNQKGDEFAKRKQFERRLKSWKKKVGIAKSFITPSNKDRNLLKVVMSTGNAIEKNVKVHTCKDTHFYSDAPTLKTGGQMNHVLKRYIFERIRNAKDRVLIESPYFILNKETRDTLKDALNNGVKVQALTNGLFSTDAIYVNTVFTAEIGKWLDRGLEAFLYRGDLVPNYQTVAKKYENARWGTHAKSIVFDDDSVMIGSYNFDPRSNNLNSEMAIFCDGNKELAKELTDSIEQRMDSSYKISTRDELKAAKFNRVTVNKRIAFFIQMLPSLMFKWAL